MIWESMQSVLPQCPDVHDADVADVVDVEDDRQVVPRQQYRRSSASTTTNNKHDAGRDIEAHHLNLPLPIPLPLAMERSLSLGGISWNDLCLYPDDDDDDDHRRQQRQHADTDFIDNDECHLYAKDNPYNVRSDDDSFNDNLSPPSALSSSSCTNHKRRKIMLWATIFGFIAAIAIALAIGMSVVANKHSQRDKEVQFTSSENASLEDNNINRDMPTTTSNTYHPTYSPTMFEPTEGEGPATPSSSSSSLSNLDSTPSTTSQMSLSESPTLQPSSSVSVLSSTSGEAIVEDESVPIETIQFTTPVPTQQSSVSNPTSSSSSSSLASSTSAQNDNNLDLSSSETTTTMTTTTTTTTTTQSCLTIELQTDQHGEETSWTLHLVNEQTGALSKLITSVDTNSYGPNEKDVMELYLDPGKYRFTLKDSYGDGFCCSNGSAGYYILSLDGKELINGGYYRFTQSYDILVGYDPTLTMSERDIQWVEAHNVRRMDWHTRNGKSYVPLVWSAELAKDAYNWAQVLVQHCDEETWHETSVSEGENLAQNIGSSNSKYGQLYPPDNVRYCAMWLLYRVILSFSRSLTLSP